MTHEAQPFKIKESMKHREPDSFTGHDHPCLGYRWVPKGRRWHHRIISSPPEIDRVGLLSWNNSYMLWGVIFRRVLMALSVCLSVCVLLCHSVDLIKQVSLRVNVFIWTPDEEVLILVNHTLNMRNPLRNIKCPTELLIFVLGQEQLRLEADVYEKTKQARQLLPPPSPFFLTGCG